MAEFDDAIRTSDPHTRITYYSPGTVEYLTDAGERWRIHGICNHCGECWAGAADPTPPTLDCPVRPDIADGNPSCALTGEYL
jgi:hypothetical protein